MVYDDYLYYFIEVCVVFEVMCSIVGIGWVIVIQQLYIYLCMQYMYQEFVDVFEEFVDYIVMFDVYGVREDLVFGVMGELVSGVFCDFFYVYYVLDWQQVVDYIVEVVRDGDFVVILGCGNVYQIILQVFELLCWIDGVQLMCWFVLFLLFLEGRGKQDVVQDMRMC